MNENNLAKIYLLVGFFGSGKTTFIRNLLNTATEQKYAIIQNQFAEGQMGIQQPIIIDQTGTPFSNFLELPNGCICCSAKNDLMAAIEYIVQNTKVKNIVVETNGIADPAQSIKQFWFDEEMNIKAQLHSVISLISAKRWDQISKDEILQKQIVYSNKILLTFVDIAGEQKYNKILQELKMINEDCMFDRSDKYQIANFINGNTIFDKDILKELHHTKASHHHHKIKSFFFSGFCQILNKLQFQKVIGKILWQSEMKILRIKGAICLSDSNYVYQLQGVEDVFEIKESKSSKELYQNKTKILIIGENVNEQILRGQFNLSKEQID